MKKNCCLIAGLVFVVACSCPRENLSEPETTAPVMAIDEALQQYGEELMQNKEGALLAVDPSTGAVLAEVFNLDYADSLRVIALAEKCLSAIVRNDAPEEVERMWRDVNEAPGTGSRLWVAHVDGLDVCGKSESLYGDAREGRPVFVGFAPGDYPRIAVLSYVKGRPLAATFSAPVGSLMMERYLLGETTRPDMERRMMEARPLPRRTAVCGAYLLRKQVMDSNVNEE